MFHPTSYRASSYINVSQQYLEQNNSDKVTKHHVIDANNWRYVSLATFTLMTRRLCETLPVQLPVQLSNA